MIITGMDHFQSVCKKKLVVSIHPSAREVTGKRDHISCHSTGFNPHFCKGSDFALQNNHPYRMFQSTLPQGK